MDVRCVGSKPSDRLTSDKMLFLCVASGKRIAKRLGIRRKNAGSMSLGRSGSLS